MDRATILVLIVASILVSGACAAWCRYVMTNADLLVRCLLDMAPPSTGSGTDSVGEPVEPTLTQRIMWIQSVAERVDRESREP